MSTIENVKTNPTPQSREIKSVTNGLDFSQFFNSEMLTSFNLNTLSDVAPPRQSHPNKSLEELRTSRDLKSDNSVREDKFLNQHSADDNDLRFNDDDNADVGVDDHYSGQNSPEETYDANLQSKDHSLEHVQKQPGAFTLTSAQSPETNSNHNPKDHKLETGPASEVTPPNYSKVVKEGHVTESSGELVLSASELIAASTENANANLQIHGLEHPTQETAILASAGAVEGNPATLKDTSPANILSQLKNIKELDQASVPMKGNNQQPITTDKNPNTITPEGALSNEAKETNVRNKGEISFGLNSENLVNTRPQKQGSDQVHVTNKSSETVRLNEGKSLPLELTQTRPVTPQTQGQNITATVNKPSLEARLDLSGSGQSQTETERAISRASTNANIQTKNETPGLKLSQLDKNIIVQTADSNISHRTTNAAGNNILQAHNSAQAIEPNAITMQRNGAPQSFNLTQQQVQSNQSNSQTSATTPLHVGANTGDNDANTNN